MFVSRNGHLNVDSKLPLKVFLQTGACNGPSNLSIDMSEFEDGMRTGIPGEVFCN